jgi:hypothetical protein
MSGFRAILRKCENPRPSVHLDSCRQGSWEAIVGGCQPLDLTVIKLTRRIDLPLLWSAQEQALGIR